MKTLIESKTNDKYGFYPDKRPIEELLKYGVANINKPAGPSSHQISDYVKKILNAKKAGHSGTLDPGVTGVLVIALNDATRVVQTLLKSGKEYVCLMHIHKLVEEEQVKEVFKKFTGKLKQLPPLRSAVKRQLRTREIYSSEILEIKGQDVLFRVSCQAGTYIRKLCHDMGQELKVGAHMAQLIRTRAGCFTDETWHTLQELKDAHEDYKEGNEKELRKIILPFEEVLKDTPKIYVMDSTVDSLAHGAHLNIPGISKIEEFQKEDLVAVLTLKGELIMIGKAEMPSSQIIKQKKGLAIKSWKVFMQRGLYPKNN